VHPKHEIVSNCHRLFTPYKMRMDKTSPTCTVNGLTGGVGSPILPIVRYFRIMYELIH